MNYFLSLQYPDCDVLFEMNVKKYGFYILNICSKIFIYFTEQLFLS